MKMYAVIGGMVLAGAVGVLSFADLPAAVPLAQGAPAVDDPAWDAWRADFDALLKADPAYQAAKQDAERYAWDDPEEYDRLDAVRETRYYKLARELYEQHFGKWSSDDVAFEEFIDAVLRAPIDNCAKVATTTCGQGQVCWVRVGSESCAFACRDAQGNCAPMPTG